MCQGEKPLVLLCITVLYSDCLIIVSVSHRLGDGKYLKKSLTFSMACYGFFAIC